MCFRKHISISVRVIRAVYLFVGELFHRRVFFFFYKTNKVARFIEILTYDRRRQTIVDYFPRTKTNAGYENSNRRRIRFTLLNAVSSARARNSFTKRLISRPSVTISLSVYYGQARQTAVYDRMIEIRNAEYIFRRVMSADERATVHSLQIN